MKNFRRSLRTLFHEEDLLGFPPVFDVDDPVYALALHDHIHGSMSNERVCVDIYIPEKYLDKELQKILTLLEERTEEQAITELLTKR